MSTLDGRQVLYQDHLWQYAHNATRQVNSVTIKPFTGLENCMEVFYTYNPACVLLAISSLGDANLLLEFDKIIKRKSIAVVSNNVKSAPLLAKLEDFGTHKLIWEKEIKPAKLLEMLEGAVTSPY
jgi:hypothetical protein